MLEALGAVLRSLFSDEACRAMGTSMVWRSCRESRQGV